MQGSSGAGPRIDPLHPIGPFRQAICTEEGSRLSRALEWKREIRHPDESHRA